MFKAFGRIGKDKVKFMVEFEPLGISATNDQQTHVFCELQRGDQKPTRLSVQPLPRLNNSHTNFAKIDSSVLECSVFVSEGGVAEPKLVQAKLFRCSQSGSAPELVATGEVNLCRHFGPFAEGTMPLTVTPIGHARGLILHSMRFSARFSVKKKKEQGVLEQCIQWRKEVGVQEAEEASQKAALESSKEQAEMEELKRASLRKQQQMDEQKLREQKARMSESEVVMGIGGLGNKKQSKKKLDPKSVVSTRKTESKVIGSASSRGNGEGEGEGGVVLAPRDLQAAVVREKEKQTLGGSSGVSSSSRGSRKAVKDDLRRESLLTPSHMHTDTHLEQQMEMDEDDPFARLEQERQATFKARESQRVQVKRSVFEVNEQEKSNQVEQPDSQNQEKLRQEEHQLETENKFTLAKHQQESKEEEHHKMETDQQHQRIQQQEQQEREDTELRQKQQEKMRVEEELRERQEQEEKRQIALKQEKEEEEKRMLALESERREKEKAESEREQAAKLLAMLSQSQSQSQNQDDDKPQTTTTTTVQEVEEREAQIGDMRDEQDQQQTREDKLSNNENEHNQEEAEKDKQIDELKQQIEQIEEKKKAELLKELAQTESQLKQQEIEQREQIEREEKEMAQLQEQIREGKQLVDEVEGEIEQTKHDLDQVQLLLQVATLRTTLESEQTAKQDELQSIATLEEQLHKADSQIQMLTQNEQSAKEELTSAQALHQQLQTQVDQLTLHAQSQTETETESQTETNIDIDTQRQSEDLVQNGLQEQSELKSQQAQLETDQLQLFEEQQVLKQTLETIQSGSKQSMESQKQIQAMNDYIAECEQLIQSSQDEIQRMQTEIQEAQIHKQHALRLAKEQKKQESELKRKIQKERKKRDLQEKTEQEAAVKQELEQQQAEAILVAASQIEDQLQAQDDSQFVGEQEQESLNQSNCVDKSGDMLADISYFRDHEDSHQIEAPVLAKRESEVIDQSNLLAQLHLDDGIIDRHSSSSNANSDQVQQQEDQEIHFEEQKSFPSEIRGDSPLQKTVSPEAGWLNYKESVSALEHVQSASPSPTQTPSIPQDDTSDQLLPPNSSPLLKESSPDLAKAFKSTELLRQSMVLEEEAVGQGVSKDGFGAVGPQKTDTMGHTSQSSLSAVGSVQKAKVNTEKEEILVQQSELVFAVDRSASVASVPEVDLQKNSGKQIQSNLVLDNSSTSKGINGSSGTNKNQNQNESISVSPFKRPVSSIVQADPSLYSVEDDAYNVRDQRGNSSRVTHLEGSGSIRESIARRSSSRFSSFVGERRQTTLRATMYDREIKGDWAESTTAEQSKMKKQVYVQSAMREAYLLLLSGEHPLTVAADSELILGHKQFEEMLRKDGKCHEAMFGMAKVNFVLKRYELCERWLQDAYKVKRDMVYRAWLGFTYLMLSRKASQQNEKRNWFAQAAFKNLDRCSKETETELIGLVGLVHLAIEFTRRDCEVSGLRTSREYLNRLSSSQAAVENQLAVRLTKVFVEMATSGHGINLLVSLVDSDNEASTQLEPYLMLLSHYKQRDHKLVVKYADQALARVTNFTTYSERLLIHLMKAKALACSNGTSKSEVIEGVSVLQVEFTRTPHFGGSLLYAYGKCVVKSGVRALVASAIDALVEVVHCGVQPRQASAHFYLAKAFLLQEDMLSATLHFKLFAQKQAQLTRRVGATTPSHKLSHAKEFLLASSTPSHISAAADVKIKLDEMLNKLEEGELDSGLQFEKNQDMPSKMDMFTGVQSELVTEVQVDSILRIGNSQEQISEASELLSLADKMQDQTLKAIYRSKIASHFKLDLTQEITALEQLLSPPQKAIQVQIQIVKVTLKALELQQFTNQKVALKRVKKLMSLLEDESRLADLALADWLDALQTLSEMLQLLASYEKKKEKKMFMEWQSLLCLLKTLQVIPEVDFSIGSARMGLSVHVSPDKLSCIAPIDMHLLDLQAIKLNSALPIPDSPSPLSFNQSPLSQLALDQSHFQIQAPFGYGKSEKMLSFPEKLVTAKGGLDDVNHRRSANALVAAMSCLSQEERPVLATKTHLDYLATFRVNSQNLKSLSKLTTLCHKLNSCFDLSLQLLQTQIGWIGIREKLGLSNESVEQSNMLHAMLLLLLSLQKLSTLQNVSVDPGEICATQMKGVIKYLQGKDQSDLKKQEKQLGNLLNLEADWLTQILD